ncbi:MAG TPA: PIN domain-containing protein [Balneolales bacterium]|nr:PIN domain-containing protein [Balneolales bacterium]
MNRIFLDTGYLIALESSDDQYHKKAIRYWKGLLQHHPLLVTTSYIFDEVTTFFNSRNRHSKALEIGTTLLTSPSVEFIHVSKTLFDSGWQIFQQHPDKRYSLTDCISLAVMDRDKIHEALSFDSHFEQAGFRKLPTI